MLSIDEFLTRRFLRWNSCQNHDSSCAPDSTCLRACSGNVAADCGMAMHVQTRNATQPPAHKEPMAGVDDDLEAKHALEPLVSLVLLWHCDDVPGNHCGRSSTVRATAKTGGATEAGVRKHHSRVPGHDPSALAAHCRFGAADTNRKGSRCG